MSPAGQEYSTLERVYTMLDFTEKMFELHMQASSTARDERLQYLSVDSFFLALLSSSDVCEAFKKWGGLTSIRFEECSKIELGWKRK